MKNKMRMMALTLAAAMLTGVSGVNAAEMTGGEISDGVFSWLLVQAYNSACSINGGTEDLWTNGIEGEETAQWILDTAVEAAKEYIAIEQEFDNEGLKLRAEEIETASDTMERYWNELGYGRYYEEYDITEDDFLETLEHNTKISVLYGEVRSDLIEEVEDSEVFDFINENGTLVQYIAVPHSAGMDEDLTEEEQEAWIDTDAVYEEYKERVENGESLETLMEEISENQEQQEAGIGSSLDNGYTETLFFSDNSSLSTGFKEALAQAEEDEIVYYDDVAQDYQLIFCKKAFTEDWEGLDSYSDTIKASLAAKKFAKDVVEWAENIELADADAIPSAEEVQEMFE